MRNTIVIIHGKPCIRRDGRFYAVNIHTPDRATRIAQQTKSTGTYWDRITRSNKTSREIFQK